jgi:Chaperone for flagella basal body P-ring formation
VLTARDLGPPALGLAQQDGALGDPVRVLNAESRRQLQGVVNGPDEVSLGATVPATPEDFPR